MDVYGPFKLSVGQLHYDRGNHRLKVWDGNDWIDVLRDTLKLDQGDDVVIPTVMIESDGSFETRVYINGVKIDGVQEVRLEADQQSRTVRCQLDFFCHVTTALTKEQK